MTHMKRFLILLLLALTFLLVMPRAGQACPNCNDIMTANADDGEDPFKEARAFNTSILFMLSVPYVILGIAGIAFWRLHRIRQAQITAAPPPMVTA
jgi:hypothetical protein